MIFLGKVFVNHLCRPNFVLKIPSILNKGSCLCELNCEVWVIPFCLEKKSFVSQWITNFLLQILSDSPAPLQSVLAIAPFISRTIHLNIVSFLGAGNTGINININVNINFDINFDTNLDINIIFNLFYYAQLSNTAFFWGIIWKSDYFDFS